MTGESLGRLEDDRAVAVAEEPALLAGTLEGLCEEIGGVASGVLGGVVGEELADVGGSDRAEDGVGEGVEEGVAVGMADGAGVGDDRDAAEDQGLALALRGQGFEAMEVVAVPDAELGERGALNAGGVGVSAQDRHSVQVLGADRSMEGASANADDPLPVLLLSRAAS